MSLVRLTKLTWLTSLKGKKETNIVKKQPESYKNTEILFKSAEYSTYILFLLLTMYNNTIMHTINMYSAAALLLMLFYAQYRVFDRDTYFMMYLLRNTFLT